MRRALLAFALLTTAVATSSARAEEPLYNLDFAELTVAQIVEIVSAITGQNVILDAGAESTRTIMVVAPRPLTADDALAILSAALGAADLALEQRGEYWLIHPR
jgi:type II secretory pathway component GspD/PulD (secretin)